MSDIKGIEVSVRDPEGGDVNFILSTMLKGLYYGSKFWNEVDQDAFFKNYEPFLKNLLLRSTVKVACLADDPDVILAYSVFRDNVIHFVFTKKSYRKFGVAKMVYPPGIDTCSHVTDMGNAMRKKLGLKFDPFNV
jgi:hypothetical protein